MGTGKLFRDTWQNTEGKLVTDFFFAWESIVTLMLASYYEQRVTRQLCDNMGLLARIPFYTLLLQQKVKELFIFFQVQRIREKIVEQEAEHIKLVDENNKLKTEKQITVSELFVDS